MGKKIVYHEDNPEGNWRRKENGISGINAAQVQNEQKVPFTLRV